MRPPDHAEPWHMPAERTPEDDIYSALILLHQAARLVPPGLSGIQAAIRIACDGLQAARLQPALLGEEGQGK